MWNNNSVQMLIQIATHYASSFESNEFKLAVYLYGLMCYESEDYLYIYLSEIDNGIEFFSNDGKRIFYIRGLNIGTGKVLKNLRSLRKKKIIQYEEIVHCCFYKVSKGHLRQGCFS